MTPIEFKKQAASMKTRLNVLGIELSHAQALEGLAAVHGFRNWHACSAQLQARTEFVDPQLDGITRNALIQKALRRGEVGPFHVLNIADPGTPHSDNSLSPGGVVRDERPVVEMMELPAESHKLPRKIAMSALFLPLGITQDTCEQVGLSDTTLMRNVALIGTGIIPVRFGARMLQEQSIRGGGWIFVDSLGLVPQRTESARGSHRILNLADPAESQTYNPLMGGEMADVVSQVMLLMPRWEGRPGVDQPWISVRYGLSVVVMTLKAAHQPITFKRLGDLLESGPDLAGLLVQFPVAVQAQAPMDTRLVQFKLTGDAVEDATQLKELLRGIAARIRAFSAGAVHRVFNADKPGIQFCDILQRKLHLHIVMPTEDSGPLAGILRRMVMLNLAVAIREVEKQGGSPCQGPPALVYLENVVEYEEDVLPRLLMPNPTGCVGWMLGIPSITELLAKRPRFEPLLVNNIETKVYFPQKNEKDANVCASLLGFKEGSSGLEQQELNYWMSPDEMQQQESGECAVSVGSKRYRLTSHP